MQLKQIRNLEKVAPKESKQLRARVSEWVQRNQSIFVPGRPLMLKFVDDSELFVTVRVTRKRKSNLYMRYVKSDKLSEADWEKISSLPFASKQMRLIRALHDNGNTALTKEEAFGQTYPQAIRLSPSWLPVDLEPYNQVFQPGDLPYRLRRFGDRVKICIMTHKPKK